MKWKKREEMLSSTWRCEDIAVGTCLFKATRWKSSNRNDDDGQESRLPALRQRIPYQPRPSHVQSVWNYVQHVQDGNRARLCRGWFRHTGDRIVTGFSRMLVGADARFFTAAGWHGRDALIAKQKKRVARRATGRQNRYVTRNTSINAHFRPHFRRDCFSCLRPTW